MYRICSKIQGGIYGKSVWDVLEEKPVNDKELPAIEILERKKSREGFFELVCTREKALTLGEKRCFTPD